MIVKCAEADALRSAFPLSVGGLYTQEEQERVMDINPAEEKPVAKRGSRATVVVQAKPVEAPVVVDVPSTPAASSETSLSKLESFVATAGFNFDALAETCMLDESLKKNAEMWTCMEDITEAQAAYILANLSVANGEMKWKRGGK